MEVHRIHFDRLDSTHTWAKAHAHELDPKKLTCITAGIQTAGLGRFKRAWISKEGNLQMSLFFCISPEDPRIANMAQMAALAASRYLIKNGVPIQIKWPNDLLCSQKKLGGILVEICPLDGVVGLVVSFGLNVNTPVETDQPSITLAQITQSNWDLDPLRDALISHFQAELEKGFSPSDLDPLLAFKGAVVSCTVGDDRFEGTLLGLTDQGHLKLQLSDGTEAHLSSGEINSLRSS